MPGQATSHQGAAKSRPCLPGRRCRFPEPGLPVPSPACLTPGVHLRPHPLQPFKNPRPPPFPPSGKTQGLPSVVWLSVRDTGLDLDIRINYSGNTWGLLRGQVRLWGRGSHGQGGSRSKASPRCCRASAPSLTSCVLVMVPKCRSPHLVISKMGSCRSAYWEATGGHSHRWLTHSGAHGGSGQTGAPPDCCGQEGAVPGSEQP